MGNLGWLARDVTIRMRRDGCLLLKDGPLRQEDVDAYGRTGADADRGRIRCPCCGWQPARQDLWACTCLHLWNTFETGGVCPACGREWSKTQCPRCEEWSRHEDWYGPDSGT
jgi:hypothetical protein